MLIGFFGVSRRLGGIQVLVDRLVGVVTTVVKTEPGMLAMEEIVHFLRTLAAKAKHDGVLVKRLTLDLVPVAAGGLHLDAEWAHHLGTHLGELLAGGVAGGVCETKACRLAVFIAQSILFFAYPACFI